MKQIIITGAAGGIGRALCSYYAQQKSWQVIGIDIVEPAQGTFDGYKVDFYCLDQSDAAAVRACFAQLTQRYGKLHVLINNGAIAHALCDLFDMTDDRFTQVIQTNLCGVFYCSRAFIHANRGADYGRIVHIASTRWAQNEAGRDAYGASKGGVVGLTQSMAVSLSETPVTVNCISPGWIATSHYDALSEVDHQQHPSGRVGKPTDIIRAVDYLLAEDNDFVNGQNLVVDGGMSKKMIYAD